MTLARPIHSRWRAHSSCAQCDCSPPEDLSTSVDSVVPNASLRHSTDVDAVVSLALF